MNNQYTRLSVNYGAEKLIDHGPYNSSGSTCNVSINGLGIPSLSYSFPINGFSLRDLTSYSSKYARWAYTSNFGNTNTLTTKPAIRATNTMGNFAVELSHTINVNVTNISTKDHGTGVIQIIVPDR